MKRPFPDHEAADAERRKQVALFRYGVIADLIHLERGERGLYAKLREKAAREWDIPGSRHHATRYTRTPLAPGRAAPATPAALSTPQIDGSAIPAWTASREQKWVILGER
jgi:hypothetical protein